jgi:hypothetical protein
MVVFHFLLYGIATLSLSLFLILCVKIQNYRAFGGKYMTFAIGYRFQIVPFDGGKEWFRFFDVSKKK